MFENRTRKQKLVVHLASGEELNVTNPNQSVNDARRGNCNAFTFPYPNPNHPHQIKKRLVRALPLQCINPVHSAVSGNINMRHRSTHH